MFMECFNFNCKLSEGPVYDDIDNSLLWVDIIKSNVHRLYLEDLRHEEFSIPNESVSCIYLIEGETNLIYIAAKRGIGLFDFNANKFTYVIYYPVSDSKLRSNDGILDPKSRSILIGLMGNFDHGPINEGKLYKINLQDKSFQTLESNVLISNGINFTKDHKNLYWTSSLEFKIYKFDYDLQTNSISNKVEFIDIKKFFPEFDSPEPDGFTITDNNEILTAVWSTNSIAHFDSNGELIKIYKFPVNKISSVCFGGLNYDDIFVTSAFDEDEGGSIYKFKIKGLRGFQRPKLKSLITL